MKSKTNSAFVAFQQLDLDFEGSDKEDVQERKDKQRQKKRKSSKKKNTENSELKGLAMLPTKKGKGKNKAKSPTPSSPEPASVEVAEPAPVEETPAPTESPAVPQPQPQATNAAPVWPVRKSAAATTPAPARVTKATKSPKTVAKATTSPPPATSTKHGKKSPTTPQTDADSGEDEDAGSNANASNALGVTYSPTQITVTSLDGSVSRQVAVHEMMDQLLRFQQQHQQDVVVKEQLQVANRNLAEQLQQGAGIISSLKNEVSMFRQMCLNLQAEVTQMRASVVAPPPGAFAPGSMPPHLHPQAHTHAPPPPPPGMS